MADTLSLMEFLQALLVDAGLRGDFGDDPQGTLAAHGLADLTPADVHDALVLVQDTQTVDYSLDAATAPPTPPPAGDDHEAAVEYLARYLAGPEQADPGDAHWTDPDPATGPAATGVDGFGAGDDTGYGAGSDPVTDDGAWTAAAPEPGPEDHGGYGPAEFDDLRHLDEFDDLGGFADLAEDLPDDHGGDPTLHEGA